LVESVAGAVLKIAGEDYQVRTKGIALIVLATVVAPA
jgi:hypothetical protein